MNRPPRVVVTRPAKQSTNIAQQLTSLGAQVICFPLIVIKALPRNEQLNPHLTALEHYNGIIFISKNAAHYGLSWVKHHHLMMADTQLGAIGKQTAQKLQTMGLSVQWQPEHSFTSEAFLALPAMQNVRGKRLLIVRGRGGRETLKKHLELRGAQVDYMEVYQRQCPPQTELTDLKKQHLAQQLDVIMLTSNESLKNLLLLLANDTWAYHLPLISGSQRITESAKNAGFKSLITTADNPSDQAMLQAFVQWQTEFNHDR